MKNECHYRLGLSMSSSDTIDNRQGRKPIRDLEDGILALEPDDADARLLKRRILLRRFWQTASRYWGKDGPRLA
jgi:hypothetical protein